MECTYIKCNVCDRKLWTDDRGEWPEEGIAAVAVEKTATEFRAVSFQQDVAGTPLRGNKYKHYCVGECAEQAFIWWLKAILNPGSPYSVGLPAGAKAAGIREKFSEEDGERLCPGYKEMLNKIKEAYARREQEFNEQYATAKASENASRAERAAKRAAAKTARAAKSKEVIPNLTTQVDDTK